MSIERTGHPSASRHNIPPSDNEPLVSGARKEEGSRVTPNHQLVEKLRNFRSGVSDLPGRVRGFFQSLHHQPTEYTIKQFAPSAEADSVTIDPPTDPAEKAKLAQDADIAAYPYHRSLEKINESISEPETGSWDTARPLALAAGRAAGLSTKGSEGFIYDQKSGFTAYILHNPSADPKEVRLVFGGTTSGKKTGGLTARSILNGGFALRQWIANAKNALLGKTPDSYQQAKKLTEKVLQTMTADKRYDGFQLTVSGHSKGGGEAAYAALSQDPPLHAICFSSAEMGSEMRQSFTQKQQADATKYITHYNIKGDFIPNIGKVATGLGHLGKVVTIPAQHAWNSPIDRHDQFTRHIHNFADKL